MELSKQVCTYKQSKKLKLLGIRGTGRGCSWRKTTFTTAVFYGYVPVNGLRAFTVAELGVMLPTLGFKFVKSNNGNGKDFFWLSSDYWKIKGVQFDNERESEARAAMLIYLLENNLTTAEEVNQRLKNA